MKICNATEHVWNTTNEYLVLFLQYFFFYIVFCRFGFIQKDTEERIETRTLLLGKSYFLLCI